MADKPSVEIVRIWNDNRIQQYKHRGVNYDLFTHIDGETDQIQQVQLVAKKETSGIGKKPSVIDKLFLWTRRDGFFDEHKQYGINGTVELTIPDGTFVLNVDEILPVSNPQTHMLFLPDKSRYILFNISYDVDQDAGTVSATVSDVKVSSPEWEYVGGTVTIATSRGNFAMQISEMLSDRRFHLYTMVRNGPYNKIFVKYDLIATTTSPYYAFAIQEVTEEYNNVITHNIPFTISANTIRMNYRTQWLIPSSPTVVTDLVVTDSYR